MVRREVLERRAGVIGELDQGYPAGVKAGALEGIGRGETNKIKTQFSGFRANVFAEAHVQGERRAFSGTY